MAARVAAAVPPPAPPPLLGSTLRSMNRSISAFTWSGTSSCKTGEVEIQGHWFTVTCGSMQIACVEPGCGRVAGSANACLCASFSTTSAGAGRTLLALVLTHVRAVPGIQLDDLDVRAVPPQLLGASRGVVQRVFQSLCATRRVEMIVGGDRQCDNRGARGRNRASVPACLPACMPACRRSTPAPCA